MGSSSGISTCSRHSAFSFLAFCLGSKGRGSWADGGSGGSWADGAGCGGEGRESEAVVAVSGSSVRPFKFYTFLVGSSSLSDSISMTGGWVSLEGRGGGGGERGSVAEGGQWEREAW